MISRMYETQDTTFYKASSLKWQQWWSQT